MICLRCQGFDPSSKIHRAASALQLKSSVPRIAAENFDVPAGELVWNGRPRSPVCINQMLINRGSAKLVYVLPEPLSGREPCDEWAL